jgi:xanthine dehydrogenase YagT iron-sulfur-binding subunit
VTEEPGMKTRLSLTVNGETQDLLVPVHKTLLEVLREDLRLTGTKHGCELGECGTCTVLVDGAPVLSCLTLPADLEGHLIKTVEGMAAGAELHPLQQAFVAHDALQCGFCTPGQILTAIGLLDRRPSTGELRDLMSGNLCRCGAYPNIIAAIESVMAAAR